MSALQIEQNGRTGIHFENQQLSSVVVIKKLYGVLFFNYNPSPETDKKSENKRGKDKGGQLPGDEGRQNNKLLPMENHVCILSPAENKSLLLLSVPWSVSYYQYREGHVSF